MKAQARQPITGGAFVSTAAQPKTAPVVVACAQAALSMGIGLGSVISYSSVAPPPQAPRVPPSVIAKAEAPPSYPGVVGQRSQQPDSIAPFSEPPTPQIAVSEPQPSYPGSIMARVAMPAIEAPFHRPARPIIAASEPRPSYPGLVFALANIAPDLDAIQIRTVYLIGSETLPPHPGSVWSFHGPIVRDTSIYTDRFTDVDGTSVTSHAPDLGGSWTLLNGPAGEITNANRLRQTGTSAVGGYIYHSFPPETPDYSVSADLVKLTDTEHQGGVVGRVDPVNNSWYRAFYNDSANTWQLGKRVEGAFTVLSSSTVVPLVAGQSYRVRLTMAGTSISLYVDDALTAGPVVDSSITAAGFAGIGYNASVTTPSDTVGLHFDNFSGVMPPAPIRPTFLVSSESPQPHRGFTYWTHGGPVQVALHTDTFTDVAGTALASHTPDAGGSWTLHASHTGSAVITDANRVRSSAAASSLWYYSGTPTSPDYDVTADVRNASGSTQIAGVAGRIDTAANTFYSFVYNSTLDAFQLRKMVAGSSTILDTGTASLAATKTVVLRLRGSSIQGYVAGVLDASANDSAITATGQQGIFFQGSSTNSVGLHIDDFDFGTAIERLQTAGIYIARSEPQRPESGRVWWLANLTPTAAEYAPKPILINPPAPPPYPGRVHADWGLTAAIAGVSVPGHVILARSEEPRPYPGWSFTSTVEPETTAQVSVPGHVVVASAEVPRPESGTILASVCRTIPPVDPLAARVVFVLSEPQRPEPGWSYAVHALPPPTQPPVATRSVFALSEAPPSHPGSIRLSTIRFVSTDHVSVPRQSYIVQAQPPHPYPGRLFGAADSTVRRGPKDTVTGLFYRVYASPTSGTPIDYTSIVATTTALTWESGTLTFPAVWKFGVRTFDGATSLEEKNIDAVVLLRLDGGGVDITAIPDAPIGLTATARANGSVQLDWHYRLVDSNRIPTTFSVYQGTGGTPSYVSAVTTTSYARGVQAYSATVTGLTDAVAYTFGIRASNATGEEKNTATVTVTADATGPSAVSGLAGEAIS